MRNLEQRMEEIQRRSEKIIKQRKKRRLCMAAACVPAVLCVTLFLPKLLPKDTMEPEFYYGTVLESYSDMSQGAAYVEVSGNGMRKTLTEPEAVDQILQLMTPVMPETNLMEEAEILDKEETVYKDAVMDDSMDYSASSTVFYSVTVYQPNGERVSYTLAGNQMEDENGYTRTLTSQELQELQILLGIAQEGETK